MEVDAWLEWAGSAPQAPPGVPPPPAGPGDLDGLYDLVVTRAARLAGTGDALLWLVDDDARLVVRRGVGRFSSGARRAPREGGGPGGGVPGGPAAPPRPPAGLWARGKGWPARSGRPAGRWPWPASRAWGPDCACPWSPARRWSGCWGWPGASRAAWLATPRPSWWPAGVSWSA